ncbi:MAG: hypothetical protein ABIK61_07690 [candidate division WOR-3 bacterium]
MKTRYIICYTLFTIFTLPLLFIFCSDAPRILPTPTNRIVLAEFFTTDG